MTKAKSFPFMNAIVTKTLKFHIIWYVGTVPKGTQLPVRNLKKKSYICDKNSCMISCLLETSVFNHLQT